jgi:hypothetical protein
MFWMTLAGRPSMPTFAQAADTPASMELLTLSRAAHLRVNRRCQVLFYPMGRQFQLIGVMTELNDPSTALIPQHWNWLGSDTHSNANPRGEASGGWAVVDGDRRTVTDLTALLSMLLSCWLPRDCFHVSQGLRSWNLPLRLVSVRLRASLVGLDRADW